MSTCCVCDKSALELFRSSGRLLPELLDAPRTSDLAPCAIPPRIMLEDEMKYVDTKRHDEDLISLGADSQKQQHDFVLSNLLGSLPSGYIFGQNVYNLINGLSVGYQDSISFADLPIPFACVATEMVSGTAKYWHTGNFSTAMRSTMSIPGVFAPVKVDGMVLVDGGMRDNYPTALARLLGADIVIGVEVSTDRKQYNEINNIGDIISQGVDMLGRSVYEYNMTLSDINIHPDLPEYDMMSFDPASIDQIILRGYVAASQKSAELAAIKERVGNASTELHNRKAVDLNTGPVTISGVDIRGVSEREKSILMRRIHLEPGDMVTRDDVEHIVAEIFGTQCYDYVTYEMEGAEEPFHLVLNCKPGPVHQFGLGLRLDSEELVSVLVNVGLNAHRLQGSRYDFTGRISVNPYFQFHYSYDAPKTPTLNATASVRWTDLNFLSFLDFSSARFNLSYLNVREEFYLSNLKWSMFDLKVGIRNDYFNVRSAMSSDNILGDYDQMLYGRTFIRMDVCWLSVQVQQFPFCTVRCQGRDSGRRRLRLHPFSEFQVPVRKRCAAGLYKCHGRQFCREVRGPADPFHRCEQCVRHAEYTDSLQDRLQIQAGPKPLSDRNTELCT